MKENEIMKNAAMKKSVLKGRSGKLANKIINNWLLGLRESNPAILDIFAERDRKPYRDLLPWSGEFAGKYITGAYYIYKLTQAQKLFDEIQDFIISLISLQADDGYLGCYSQNCHLTGMFSHEPGEIETSGTWDAWAHYHIMFGLFMWYKETKQITYLEAVKKAADLFLQTFYNPQSGSQHLVDIGSSEMNLAPIHIFALLYNETGNKAYLEFALNIADDLTHEGAGNYMEWALNGNEFYQCPKPRWESMHIVLGLAELYKATGDEKFLFASEHICRSILKTDIHNTGAFSTNEQAIGNPFTAGAIETCCVIAFNALAVEIFKLTGDSTLADYLELSHYNACMGLWSPSGRWSTYSTPMNGVKISSTTDVVFQSLPGSPELNCCSVNAARAIGMLSDWIITENNNTLYINFYESGEYVTQTGASIKIDGKYPLNGDIYIQINGYEGELALRIPAWSKNTKVKNGDSVVKPENGGYWYVKCDGEISISLSLDMNTRRLEGELDFSGFSSFYRGPILFGTDTSLCGEYDLRKLPILSVNEINEAVSVEDGDAIRITLKNGVILTDFYHIGKTGSVYITWLKVQ